MTWSKLRPVEAEGRELTFLLSSEDAARELGTLLDNGKTDEASDVLKKSAVLPDHDYPEKMSDSSIIWLATLHAKRF